MADSSDRARAHCMRTPGVCDPALKSATSLARIAVFARVRARRGGQLGPQKTPCLHGVVLHARLGSRRTGTLATVGVHMDLVVRGTNEKSG